MIKVIYWTQTGNTEEMAKAICEGVTQGGGEAQMLNVSEVKAEDLKDDAAFALGCPAMGAEELEECEMEPFAAELEQLLKGKTIGLFGSYGWGDGEWMRSWTERMQQAGATVIDKEGLICQGGPDEADTKKCIELGKKLAEA